MSDLSAELAGRRILVAEDEYMIAGEVASVLHGAGGEVIGPVASFEGVLRLIAAEERIDGALLDVNLRGVSIWPAVAALQARNVPVLLSTGYDAAAIPAQYASLPRLEKPASERELVRVLALICGDRPGNP